MNNKKYSFPQFKKFVTESVDYILRVADLPHFERSIIFENEYKTEQEINGSNHGVEAEIDVLPEYQSFDVTIYKVLFDFYKKGKRQQVFDALCHEIGHVHTSRLAQLAIEPYKTEKEVEHADEELTTKIGHYLSRISNIKDIKS